MKPLVFLFIFSLSAQAQVFRGPISAAMGGTGRAAMDSVEGAFLNPALIALIKDHQLSGYYRDGEMDPGQHRQGWGVGAADNSAGVLFPGTLNYVRLHDTGRASNAANSELIHAAIAKTYKDFAFGVSGYRLDTEVDNDKDYVQWNFSLGVVWIGGQSYGLGYVLQNIALPGSDVPAGLREDLQQGIGGFAALGDIVHVRADITRHEQNNPQQKMIYMLGFENMVSSFGVFRIGYRMDDEHGQRYLTAGAALQGPRMKLDYSLEKNLKGTGDALHSVDMRIPF